MVNGNYILYGDRPSSELEIVEDHVHPTTPDKKSRRKAHRTANELQNTLNMSQLDNDTDSVKYEKREKEPKLLRYVPTSDMEENYVTDKYESYDLKPSEERPRKHAFTKKPKNPADGSVNYAYSRSSSSCSSPNGNLPTISEHTEQYGTYRMRAPCSSDDACYESKLDKYFAKPREVRKFAAKGSHPDSLYRVATSDGVGAGKAVRVMRALRWPAALVTVCVALAVFVYFLMPDNMETEFDLGNGTNWDPVAASVGAHTQRGIIRPEHRPPENSNDKRNSTPTQTQGSKTPEIDFYSPDTAKMYSGSVYTPIGDNARRNLPIAPVFPAHITPEVQYGNEKADTDKLRNPKQLEDSNVVPEESTMKPHITQNPETPLAISIKDGVTTSTETIHKAETLNDLTNYGEKLLLKKLEGNNIKLQSPVYKGQPILPPTNNQRNTPQIYDASRLPEFPPELQELYQRRRPAVVDVNFTSGHSKFFGISIEDAENMRSTTQSSTYNTRVSPTLPTWRDGDDTTTKKYPVNVNDAPQCRSTRLAFCRGVLPYDLAGPAATLNGVDLTQLLPQVEYLVSTNCSERVTQFMCALLEPECSPPPYPPKLPCYNLCKAITDSCDGMIPRALGAAFNCNQYASGNCVFARSPCSEREFPCGDGSCVPRDWLCDGSRDCPGNDDEDRCVTCEPNEFRCQSGGCIQKRWLCDGYSDCPSGEDESETVCGGAGGAGDAGEAAAGSAPAPAVRRPHRMPADLHAHEDNDGSKELLITSDSSNALKKNYTRRPSLSRLSPYRPSVLESRSKSTDASKTSKYSQSTKRKPTNEQSVKAESTEDVNVGDLGFFDDIEKDVEVKKNAENESPKFSRASESAADVTHLDKSVNKLDKIVDGSALLRKAVAEQEMQTQDSPESNNTNVDKDPEYAPVHAEKSSPFIPGGAHARSSPCPSGELRCVDGRCITLAQLCDGTIDCTDHADEDNCYT